MSANSEKQQRSAREQGRKIATAVLKHNSGSLAIIDATIQQTNQYVRRSKGKIPNQSIAITVEFLWDHAMTVAIEGIDNVPEWVGKIGKNVWVYVFSVVRELAE